MAANKKAIKINSKKLRKNTIPSWERRLKGRSSSTKDRWFLWHIWLASWEQKTPMVGLNASLIKDLAGFWHWAIFASEHPDFWWYNYSVSRRGTPSAIGIVRSCRPSLALNFLELFCRENICSRTFVILTNQIELCDASGGISLAMFSKCNRSS